MFFLLTAKQLKVFLLTHIRICIRYGYNSNEDSLMVGLDVGVYLKKLRQTCPLPSDFYKQCLVGGDESEDSGKKKSRRAVVAALTKDVTKKGAQQYSEMQELARQQEERKSS